MIVVLAAASVSAAVACSCRCRCCDTVDSQLAHSLPSTQSCGPLPLHLRRPRPRRPIPKIVVVVIPRCAMRTARAAPAAPIFVGMTIPSRLNCRGDDPRSLGAGAALIRKLGEGPPGRLFWSMTTTRSRGGRRRRDDVGTPGQLPFRRPR